MDNWQVVDISFSNDGQELGFNLRLNPELTIHRQLIRSFRHQAMHEASRANFLFNVLRPGDVVVDAGAHLGYFSLLASVLVGRRGFVYAFEPERRNFIQLLANIALNRAGNVQAFEQALAATSNEATLYVNMSGNDGAHSLAEPSALSQPTAYRPEPIQVTTLDDVFGTTDATRVRVLKVATEGTETNVLLGAKRHLERKAIDLVLAQFNSRRLRQTGASEADLRATMMAHGYECYGLTNDANLVHVPAGTEIVPANQDVSLSLVFALPDTVQRLTGG
jgi:FkbM family methyltransferase